jgi:DNA-binding transcriptional LysR family regulator
LSYGIKKSMSIRILDIDDLILLRCLWRGETMGQASKTLAVSQPATTQRMRKMEAHFAPLIERGPHRATLTINGQRIAMLANAALQLLEAIDG